MLLADNTKAQASCMAAVEADFPPCFQRGGLGSTITIPFLDETESPRTDGSPWRVRRLGTGGEDGRRPGERLERLK